MTDDINNYTFDFANEVQRLRRELGLRGSKIIFVEVNVDQLHKEPVKILQTIGDSPIKAHIHEEIRRHYKGKPQASSFQEKLEKEGFCSNYVSMRVRESFTGIFGEKNKDMLRLFLLYHETAHALITGPAVDQDHPYQECAADSYAALRLFQRFGQEAAPLLSMISWYRSYEALVTDTSHLSTTVLDRIIADSSLIDFSRLTSHGTIVFSKDYAAEGTPSVKMLKKFRQVFARDKFHARSPYHAALLMDTALNKLGPREGSQFSFYIGAKYFEPFMYPNGIEFDDGMKKDKIDNSPQTQKRYRELIENSADTTKLPHVARLLGVNNVPSRLRRIFNKLARKPVAKTSLVKFLRVTLPAGQERFTFKAL